MDIQTELEIKELAGQKRPRTSLGNERTEMINKIEAILTEWDNSLADEPEVLTEMAEGVATHYDDDGYALARELEKDHCIDPDAILVDALDSVSCIKYQATKATVERWVRDNEITCPFEIGAKIKTPSIDGVGEVYQIDAKLAQCSVRFACLGHVENGVGTHGRILNFEDMEPAA